MEKTSPSLSRSVASVGQLALERFYSFRLIYLAIFVFLLLFVFTVKATERLLDSHFHRQVAKAVQVTDLEQPVVGQIRTQMAAAVRGSVWVRIGGVHVSTHIMGRDGRVLLLNGHSLVPPPTGLDLAAIRREAESLLPAIAEVDDVSVPINSLLSNGILLTYAALLLQTLFLYHRGVARKEGALLEGALRARDSTARRAESIERELDAVRQRLLTVEPSEREHADEIGAMQMEREALHAKLSALAAREEELRGKAEQAMELVQERQALEDLLDEAAGDLGAKNEEIQRLERRLKRATRQSLSKSSRGREGELLTRRLRVLYKNLEIDDRAVQDLVALRDESMKLKAEESLKRLADEADNVTVRRKVGGLPPYLSIFELGFAGKGRIYYTKGSQRRFRVLTIGAKNSQKTDLEYLSRLDRSEMA